MARLKDRYNQEIRKRLGEQLGETNVHAIPRLEKIVVNMGVGAATQDRKHVVEAAAHLATITGQKPLVTKAKKSVSSFRLREGMDIGCKVTLRGERMYEFLDRLISLALPRVRDFRGVNPKGFDGRGNFSLGLGEQLVFPEIDADKVTRNQGMNVTVVTTAKTDAAGRLLLKELGMPFATDEKTR
jgi:large subunit ribosomal protein L5